MAFINYDNPEYQQMMQRAMANPHMRSNPMGAQRKVQRKFVDDRMKQHTALDSAVRAQARQKMESEFANRNMALKEQAMGLRGQEFAQRVASNQIGERYRTGELGYKMTRMKDQEDDLGRQTLLGLAPMAYGAWERKRRTDLDESDRFERAQDLAQHTTKYNHLSFFNPYAVNLE